MSSKLSFNAKSFSERGGKISGMFMGRMITNIEVGLEAFGKLAQGMSNEALRIGTSAIKAVVQTFKRAATIPYAQDARELALEAAAAKEAKKTPPRKPGPPKLSPA